MITALVVGLGRCGGDDNSPPSDGDAKLAYLNHHDSVGYVGIETCRTCHTEIYESFVHTGMGSSFGVADTQKSTARFTAESHLYDPHLNMHYDPQWINDSLWLQEYRLDGDGDTSYQQHRRIDYVVGSGQHTNSHMVAERGYLYQAPFTWYAQEERLDLPPGFEKGANSRFSRLIGLECTSCHNAMPTGFVKGSSNKYHGIPGAINCERCHGPGELHVKRVSSGNIVDTAVEIDPSIVNVAKLPSELQFEVCQRCHLQGNTVLQPGKSFMDFKPGMKLNEVMEIYLPRYSNAEDEFIMASHVDRFKQSACFIKGGQSFNCTSCHNPHLSVKATKVKQFNATCETCHQGPPNFECTEEEAALTAASHNCVSCHMPASGSTDIPHVTVHDHKIDVPAKTVDTTGIKRFLELAAVNNPAPTDRSKAVAYLQQFERFEAKPFYLDSARYFLDRAGQRNQLIPEWIKYYFLRQDKMALRSFVSQRGINAVLQEISDTTYDNRHAWAAYQVGEAFDEASATTEAIQFYRRAVDLAPYVLDFRLKLANAHRSFSRLREARQQYEFILQEQPYHAKALNNLGYLELQEGLREEAIDKFKKALEREPDYELAWLNLANAYLMTEERAAARQALEQALRINPQNTRAQQVLSLLKKET